MKNSIPILPILLAACASAPKGEKKDTQEVSVEVARIIPANENLFTSAVEVVLRVENPTDSALPLDRVEYEVVTGDEVAGTIEGVANIGAAVDIAQVSEVKFAQSIPLPEDEAKYKALIDARSFPVTIKGKLVLEGGRSLAFERASEVSVPSLPNFTVYDAQAARYGEGGVDVTVFLRLINENVFPVVVERLRYTLFIADKKVKSEQTALGERIIAGAAEEYEVSVVLEGKKWSPEDLRQILSAGRVSYRVEAKLEMKRMATIPFEQTGEITLAGSE
ncbi:MAG: LEA type 2 family protein [Deltaproteobacteria bacterium]|nr:LEA type 2 family protein [Deltaproteobacteria bacterium]